MKKLNFAILITLALVTSIYSCKKDNKAEKYRVVMLAQGNTFDDLSFLESCKKGLERAKNDYNLDVTYDIDTASNNYYERIEKYCNMQYDLVITIGFMWVDAATSAAESYPNSNFLVVDTKINTPHANLASIAFEVDEAAFPLGFLAAWWADTHDTDNPTTGYVGALNIPQIRQFAEPFNNGVLWYNQQNSRNVDTIGCYAGDFFDFELGKYLADSLISSGADVIFGIGSETGNGALMQAKEENVVGIGVDVDQYYSYPEVSDILVSSAMKGLDNAIYGVIVYDMEGEFPGAGVYRGRLANGGVDIVPFHDFINHIPDSIKTDMEIIKIGIMDGSISTGW